MAYGLLLEIDEDEFVGFKLRKYKDCLKFNMHGDSAYVFENTESSTWEAKVQRLAAMLLATTGVHQ